MPLLYFQNHLKKKTQQIFKKGTFLVASLRITLKKKKNADQKLNLTHHSFFFFFFFSSSSSSSLMGSYTPFSPN